MQHSEAALGRLEREHENLRASLAWCLSAGEGGRELGLALGGRLGWFWHSRGYLAEGREQLTRLLALEPPPGPTASLEAVLPGQDWKSLRASLLNSAGLLADQQGDYEAVRRYFEEGLTLYEQLGNRHGISISLLFLGAAAREQGDLESARSSFERALTLHQQDGDHQGIGGALGNLGSVALRQGELTEARRLFEQSQAISDRLGDKQGSAWGLHERAIIARRCDDPTAGRALEEQSLMLRQEAGSRQGISECLVGFAELAEAEGQPERAARLLGAAAALRESIGYTPPGHEREAYEQGAAAARAALGEERFGGAWAAGQALTMEQAVTEALERHR